MYAQQKENLRGERIRNCDHVNESPSLPCMKHLASKGFEPHRFLRSDLTEFKAKWHHRLGWTHMMFMLMLGCRFHQTAFTCTTGQPMHVASAPATSIISSAGLMCLDFVVCKERRMPVKQLRPQSMSCRSFILMIALHASTRPY